MNTWRAVLTGAAVLIGAETYAQSAPETATAAPEGAVAGSAETDSAGVQEELNREVVTASGTAESQALAAANMVTVGWEEIARRRYRSLAEILSDIPGLYVMDDLVQPSIAVRGVTGGLHGGTRILKVMINGVPVSFRPELTAFVGPEYLPVQAIERVEIAKGPLSALYGANAFLATVNVITRSDFGANVVVEAAGRGLAHGGGVGMSGSVLGGYSDETRSLLVAVTGERVDRSGLQVQRTFAEQDGELARYRPFFAGESSNDIAAPRGAFAQFRTQTPVGDVFVQGGIQQLDSMGEFQLNSVLTHASRHSVENMWASARHERQWSSQVHSATWLGWSRGAPTADDRLFLTGTQESAFTRRFSYWALDGGAEATWLLLPRLSVKAGADFTHEPQRVLSWATAVNAASGQLGSGDFVELIGPGDTTEITTQNIGAHLQAVWEPLNDLRLTADGRVDLPNLFPAQPSWRMAAARRWTEAFTTKLVVGEAFQAPSATLLYGLTGFGAANNVIGNRTLTNVRPLIPQRVRSVEAVASVQVLGRVSLELGAFGQEVNDKIEFVQAGPNFQARNQGQEQIVGGEAIVRVALGRLSITTAGEILRQVVDGAIVARAPSMYPAHRASLDMGLALPEYWLHLSTRLVHAGPRGASQSNVYLNNDTPYSLPAYTTVDATVASFGLSALGAAQTAVSLTARNIFNAQYSEPGFGGFDLPVLGRTFLLELRQTY